MIRWKLKEIMARHDISGKDLAIALKMRTASITHLRQSKTIPAIGGDKLEGLAIALSELAKTKIRFADLYEETD